MKKSELNRYVLENFLLHLTHCSEDVSERDFDEKMSWTPRELYQHLNDYIEEDHVDGKENPEDHIVTYRAESSFEVEDEERKFLENVVVVADFGEEGTQTICSIEGNDVEGVNELLEIMKDPYGNRML